MTVPLFGKEGFHNILPALVDAVGNGAFQLDYCVFGHTMFFISYWYSKTYEKHHFG